MAEFSHKEVVQDVAAEVSKPRSVRDRWEGLSILSQPVRDHLQGCVRRRVVQQAIHRRFDIGRVRRIEEHVWQFICCPRLFLQLTNELVVGVEDHRLRRGCRGDLKCLIRSVEVDR